MGTGTRPVHREAVVWASRTLRVGVGCGPDVWLQALFSAGVMTVGTACLWREPGAAQLSRYGRGGEGGCPEMEPEGKERGGGRHVQGGGAWRGGRREEDGRELSDEKGCNSQFCSAKC